MLLPELADNFRAEPTGVERNVIQVGMNSRKDFALVRLPGLIFFFDDFACICSRHWAFYSRTERLSTYWRLFSSYFVGVLQVKSLPQ